MANLYVAEKQFAEALDCYHELYRLDKNNWDAVYHLGLYYGSSGINLDSSLKYLEQAHRMNPNDFRPYRDLGLAYGSKGQYQKALQMLNKSIEMGNKEPATLRNIAITYEKMGHMQKAAEYLKRFEQARQNPQKR
jgi:tetratricopeptide (TPR) repeat protein